MKTMIGMNKLMNIILLLIILPGCNIKNNTDSIICSPEVYSHIYKNDYIYIIAKYQMSYTPKHKLTIEEVKAQNEAISVMHKRLISKMKNIKYSNVTKFESLPLISMSVEKKGLEFLCGCKLLQSVNINSLHTIN